MGDGVGDSIIATLLGEPGCPQGPGFVTIALLYARNSRTGKPLWYAEMLEPGRSERLRLYLFAQQPRQAHKDTGPEYALCMRIEDYERLRNKLPQALAVKVPERT